MVGKGGIRGGKMVLVKLKNREHSREVMTEKRGLYEISKKIEDDLT